MLSFAADGHMVGPIFGPIPWLFLDLRCGHRSMIGKSCTGFTGSCSACRRATLVSYVTCKQSLGDCSMELWRCQLAPLSLRTCAERAGCRPDQALTRCWLQDHEGYSMPAKKNWSRKTPYIPVKISNPELERTVETVLRERNILGGCWDTIMFGRPPSTNLNVDGFRSLPA